MSAPSILQRGLHFSAPLVLLAFAVVCGTLGPTKNEQPLTQLAALGEGTVSALAWSPDGKWMAMGGSLGIHLYDATTLQESRYVETRAAIDDLAFSPDSHTLIAVNRRVAFSLWNVDTGRPFQAITETEAVNTFRLSDDGRLLATGGYYGVHVWDVASGHLVHTLGEESLWWNTITFSPDSRTVYAASSGSVAGVWDLSTGEWLYTLESTINNDVVFSPDGALLALTYTVGASDTIKVLDAHTGQLVRAITAGWYNLRLAFSPDGSRLAAMLRLTNQDVDYSVRIWDVATGEVLHTLAGEGCLAFGPNSRFLLVGSTDSTMQLWDTATWQILHTFPSPGWQSRPSFSPDGRMLAISTDVGAYEIDVSVFDTSTGQLARTFTSQSLNGIALASGERLFVSRPDETTAWRWHAATQQLTLLNTFPGSRLMALSPDGRWLALVETGKPAHSPYWQDGSIEVWDTDTGRLTHTLTEGPAARVNGMAFSPDSKLLASTMVTSSMAIDPSEFYGSYSPIHLWNVETGALLAVRRGYPEANTLEAFVTEDRLFTTRCTGDSCPRLFCDLAMWDVGTLVSQGDDAAPLWVNCDFWVDCESGLPVQDVMLNPDRTVVIALLQDAFCSPGSAAIVARDVETGRKLLALSFTHGRFVGSVAASPTDPIIAVGMEDGALDQWNIDTGENLYALEGLTAGATSLAYSPDGRWLVSGNADGALQIWSVASGRLLHTQAGHTLAVTALLFSSDGRTFYSASDDGTVRAWQIAHASLAAIQEALPTPGTDCVTLPIAALANSDTDFQSPPTGYVALGGIPFRLSDRVFKSQAATPPYSFYPTSVLLEKDVPHAQKAHLLLNTGNGFTEFAGQAIGQVVAYCDDTPTIVTDLRLGQEVREWHTADNVVSTATQARQVWSGLIISTPSEMGYIDMLSLDLPAECQTGTLTAIEIVDTSADTVGSPDPALNLFGVTVEYRR
ncbi:MAG: PD40 domain-containing protein [Anaerolineae bacterium]|nr:PD40 domain-containing protein [Anaerolineae bacterium]